MHRISIPSECEKKRLSMPRAVRTELVGLVLLSVLWACGDDSSTEPSEDLPQDVDPSDFTHQVTNPFFPLEPGTVLIYEGEDDGETERVVVEVTADTRRILGVECVVVRDRVWIDGDLVEDTFDWFAQHANGDVWYFGEDSKEIEDGEVISREGSWEAGVDEAEAGILMKGAPKIGDEYQQEYYEDEAEDRALVLSLDQTIGVALGSFSGCLQTKEWSPLEPGIAEHKFYAPGIGLILETKVEGGESRLELVEVTRP